MEEAREQACFYSARSASYISLKPQGIGGGRRTGMLFLCLPSLQAPLPVRGDRLRYSRCLQRILTRIGELAPRVCQALKYIS